MDETAIFNTCHVHLAYVESSVYAELKPKPFSGNIPDPITIQLEGKALMNVRGRGRPRQKPLNLVKKKTTSKASPSVHATIDYRYELNSDMNQDPIPILPGVNVDPISVPIISTGLTVFLEQEPIVQQPSDSSELELTPATANAVPLPMDDLSTTEKCELDAAMQNRLNEQQKGVTLTTQETEDHLNAASGNITPSVPISWEVGTSLVYVTFDQIQGEIMEMEDLQSPKGVFKTTKHGIVKHKNTHYFLCLVCGIHKMMTSKLNVHYRNRHKPLKYDKCSMVFNTPSALTRHSYTHQKPRHFCTQCRKGYYFLGELSQHSLTHQKIHTHLCNYGSCTKGYLSNTNLLKHVRTHKTKEVKCTKCDYQSKEKKLLQSHM